MSKIKLHVHQLVVEVLTLMRENGLDKSPGRRIPVYQKILNFGHVSYQDLMDFLCHEADGRNVYMHKQLFDLESALIAIRNSRRKANIPTENIMRLFAVLALIGIGLWAFDWVYRGGTISPTGSIRGRSPGWNPNTGLTNDNHLSPSRTVSTPKGKRYRIMLPDGSKVWLNSASEISYPPRFTGKQRAVFLAGEAYFEVVKNKLCPFIVKTIKQEVEVLGTRFNVNAYGDEDCVKTTLLEGSVKVTPAGGESRSVVLRPNQLSILTDTHIDVEEADAEMEVAWKDGEYWFRKEPLENIMRVLTRWHDVEVIYEDGLAAKQKLGGSISRSWKLTKVLNTLELSGVAAFKLQGNKIFVSGDLDY